MRTVRKFPSGEVQGQGPGDWGRDSPQVCIHVVVGVGVLSGPT